MRIAMLLSGGVDSSVALNILKRAGHDVTAFYLKIWLEDELSYLGSCPWEEDLSYARAVCAQAGVPLEVLSCQRDYWDSVVAAAIADIKAGRTPNPDMLCNQRVKFGAFDARIGHEFDKIATGHYARGAPLDPTLITSEVHLYRSPDEIKDQTYFLAALTQAQLARALFPIGGMLKEEVRALAHEWDLPTKTRKDSQGICFLGKIKFTDFVRHHLGICKGPLRDYETGADVGEHDGFWYYTIGQRQGIKLSGGPWYVVAKDVEHNIVYISRRYYDSDKVRNDVYVKTFNWIGEPPDMPASVSVKLRHGPQMHQAQLELQLAGGYLIHLEDRDQGIAPGQYAVVYDGMRCMGGGVIQSPPSGKGS